MTAFSLTLLLHTITTGATLINNAQFTTTNSATKSGATLTIENSNDVKVNTSTNYWNVVITDQTGWQFRLNLNSSWGFHVTKVSTVIFTMDGIVPPGIVDQDWVISFSVKSAEYFSAFIPLEPNAQSFIVPNCTQSNVPTLLSGDVYTAVNDINSTKNIWNSRVLAVGFPTQDMAGLHMKPLNLAANKSIEYPIIYQLENDPINDILTVTFTNPIWESHNFRQTCRYKAFASNEGLNIFIAGDDPGEKYAVSMFDIKYYYDTDNPTISPTRFPSKYPTLYPSSSPSKYPSSYPSKFPTEVSDIPTIVPTYTPTKAPSESEGKIPIDDLATTSEFVNTDGDNDDLQQTTNIRGIPLYILYIIGIAIILCLCVLILGILAKMWRNKKDEKLVTADNNTVKKNKGKKMNELTRITSDSLLNTGEIVVAMAHKQDRLGEWLTNIKLMHLYDLFAKEKFDVNFEIIYQLRDCDLKDMGINTMSERKIILNQIVKDQMTITPTGAISNSTTHELTSELMSNSAEKRGVVKNHDDRSDSELFNNAQVTITPVIKETPNDMHTMGKEKFLLDSNMQREIQAAIYETSM